MEYNFINPLFFIGLIGGAIPWALFFDRAPISLIYFQVFCMLFGLANLLYGSYAIFF